MHDPPVDIILEPVQKWQFPDPILSMTASNAMSTWSSALILTTGNQLFRWTPLEGFRPASSQQTGPHIPQKFLRARSAPLHLDERVNMESTLHPMVSFLSVNKYLLSCDMRCPSPVDKVLSASKDIRSISQHGSIGHHFLMSSGNKVKLLDTRYASKRVDIASRIVPHGHSVMKFVPGQTFADRDSTSEVVLGWCESGDQVMMHSIEGDAGGAGGNDGLKEQAASYTRLLSVAGPIRDSVRRRRMCLVPCLLP